MANWNDRRGQRGRGPDDSREDIHQGPWSPYNGLARARERERYRNDDYDARTWGDRGRDYWVEDDRWEDRRMGMGDQWRHRDDDQDVEELEQQWGNRMGMREEPSERAVPRAGAWQREPRYTEMERMWSDRDDHPWSNERRATDQERREHRDYAHSLASDREHRDEYARERGGEQYPAHTREEDQPRNWTERTGRGAERYHDQRHEDRLRAGRDEQHMLDQERFGHQEPQWLRRSREDQVGRGRDDRDMRRDYRDMHGRDNRDRQHRDDRDMRGPDHRGMQHRDDRDLHQTRDTRGRDDRDMRGREMYGRDMRERQMHGRDDGDIRGHQMREMDNRDQRGRNLYRNDTRDRDMRGRDERDQNRDDDQRQRDDRDRSGSRFGHRGDRNRYD